MLLEILLLILVFIVVAMMWTEGLWGNAVTFVNVLFAAMVATNYFEPAARFLEEEVMESYTYLVDFLCIWGIFVIAFLITRAATDQLSKHRVRFRLPVEIGGNLFFALLTAAVLVMFTTTSLHTAPLARTAVRGSFQEKPASDNFFWMAPDRMWLAFMQSRSYGALSRGDASSKSPYDQDEGTRVFDPKGEFVIKYGARRQSLYQLMTTTGKMRVGR